MSEFIPRPLPIIDADTRPYWEAAKRHQLTIQRCRACRRHLFYPRALCPHCHSPKLEWREVSGEGTIFTFTIARRPAGPAFQGLEPYVVALVDLAEGARLMTNIVTGNVDSVRIGQKVRVEFQDVSPEISLPAFKIVG